MANGEIIRHFNIAFNEKARNQTLLACGLRDKFKLFSSARTVIFILLSIGLHCLGLTYDIRLPLGQQSSNEVTIGYVTRAIEDFQPTTEKLQDEVYEDLDVPLENQHHTEKHIQSNLMNKLLQEKDIVEVNHHQADSQAVGDRIEVQPTARISTQPIVKKAFEAPAIETSSNTKADARDVEFSLSPAPAAEAEDGPILNEEYRRHQNVEQNAVNIRRANNDKKSESAVALTQHAAFTQQYQDQKTEPQSQSAAPRYDINPPPVYPRVAKLRGWEGVVRFEVFVLKDGRVGNFELLTSSGYRSLDNAAKKVLRRWKFKPATISGIQVDSHVTVPIRFSLRTQLMSK